MVGYGAAYFGSMYFWGDPPSPTDSGYLRIDPAYLNFGTVNATPSFLWKVALRNDSNWAVAIMDISTSCNCTAVNPRQLFIPVKEQKEVAFVIDTTPRNGVAPARIPRQFSVSFRPILSGNRPYPRTFTLTGNVRDPIWSRPPGIVYGGCDALIQDQPSPAHRVTLHDLDGRPGRIVCACPPQLGEVVLLHNAEVADTYTLEFTPKPQPSTGPFAAEIVVRKIDDSGRELFVSAVPLAGSVVSPLCIHPPAIVIPNARFGETHTASCALWLAGDMPMVEPPQLTCESPNIVLMADPAHFPASAYALRVALRPDSHGTGQSLIRVSVKADNGRTYSAILPIHWHCTSTISTKGAGHG
jgi:hypothetical protein